MNSPKNPTKNSHDFAVPYLRKLTEQNVIEYIKKIKLNILLLEDRGWGPVYVKPVWERCSVHITVLNMLDLLFFYKPHFLGGELQKISIEYNSPSSLQISVCFSCSSVFFHWNSRLENAPSMDTVLLQKGKAKVEFSKRRKQKDVGIL